jgi:mono/diheme cytochrome c family protein
MSGNGKGLPVAIFTLTLIALFNLFAAILPQVEGERPGESTIDPARLEGAELVAAGEALYHGKGACSLCHNEMGRAPELLAVDLAQIASERIANPDYRGAATDTASYLRESLVDPDAWVVAGYGRKGSGDSESPMPAADKPPASLTTSEIGAIVAFLLAKDGLMPAIEPAQPAETTEPATAATEQPGPYHSHGCAACHPLDGTPATIAPLLTDIGQRLDREQLRQAILNPSATIASGYSAGLMPEGYGERLTAAELEQIIDLLLGEGR